MIFSNITNRTLSLSSTVRALRAPSIRFRYGASRDQKAAAAPAAAASASATASPTATTPGEPIYDFQIPQKWRRRPMSEEEIAYINRGGPE